MALTEDWDRAREVGEYRVSTRGLSLDEVGFIHASTAAQLPAIASAFYSGSADPLVVLVMDEDALRDAGIEVRHEDGGDGTLYPHLYGPISTALVLSARAAHFDETGAFCY